MKYIFMSVGGAFLMLSILTACQTAASPTNIAKVPSTSATAAQQKPVEENHAEHEDAPRITLADAKKDFDAGNVVFIDTRGADAYKSEHIKGALNIGVSDLNAKLKEIPTGKKIIAYCS